MVKAFTANSKTILSVDFSRDKTCPQICSYCYVEQMERIYKAYSSKINKNHEWVMKDPVGFANQLNHEYRKLRQSKAKTWKRLDKLPVRIYGSGDYIPAHYDFLKHLDFKFYIISKTLTLKTMDYHVQLLAGLTNLTSVVFSIDTQNSKNYKNVKSYYKQNGYQIAFTGLPHEFRDGLAKNESYDIFFNTGRKKVELEQSRELREQCPCDSKALAHAKSCSFCNKCWRSSEVKNENWNFMV